jgi:hypothetical protein
MADSASTGAPKGAVFLSYASQDAEAAKRICKALQDAGLEVWFDQSELRGGDAWDQRIRRQIKECALFVPVISAHTQERPEGYFRLEWHLAEQRTFLMAHDQPFLVPVVIDATADAAARVPERFRERQWTRLPGGETPAAFGERLIKLLEGSGTDEGPVGPSPGASLAGPRPAKRSRRWILAALLGIVGCGALALWQLGFKRAHPSATSPPDAPQSEAGNLVAKAWAQMSKTAAGPEELEIADGYCKRAADLDPTNAEVWAAWSQVESRYLHYDFDRSAERREAARSKAARALKLAPDSFEARFAQANYLFCADPTESDKSAFAAEAERLLGPLLQERPDEPRVLLVFAGVETRLGHADKVREALNRLAKNPQYAARALAYFAFFEYYTERNSRAAEALLSRSLAVEEYWDSLGMKILLSLYWRGDAASAKAALDKIPLSVLQTDWGVGMACKVYDSLRQPEEWLVFLKGVPRPWIHATTFDGPVGWCIGQALQEAGRKDAARMEWQKALKLVEAKLSDQPTSADLLGWKAQLLIDLGEYAEAENGITLKGEVEGSEDVLLLATLRMGEGKLDAAMDLLEAHQDEIFSAALLRVDSHFAPLRDFPRFKALLGRLDADPKMSPNAPQKLAASPTPTA